MEGSSNIPKKIKWDEWATKLKALKIRKEDMNELVMNFLTTEGYYLVAQKFLIESGTFIDTDLVKLSTRDEVRRAIMCGKIEDAFEVLNSLYPEIMENNKEVVFYLHQQKMIELIRKREIKEAVDYGRQHILQSLDTTDKRLLEEYQNTVSLVGFEDPYNCPAGKLMGFPQLMKVVNELNRAILNAQGEEKVSTLQSLLKKIVLEYYEVLPSVDLPCLALSTCVFNEKE